MQVFIARFFPLSVFGPGPSVAAHLLGDPVEHRVGQRGVACQRITRVAQQTHLHREAEAVGGAAALPDQRQVGVRKTVVLNQVILTSGQNQQTGAFGFRK